MGIFLTVRTYQQSNNVPPGRFSPVFHGQESNTEVFGTASGLGFSDPGTDWVPIEIAPISVAFRCPDGQTVGEYNFWSRIGGVDVDGPIVLNTVTGNVSATLGLSHLIPPTSPIGADLAAKKYSIRDLQLTNPVQNLSQTFAYSPADGSNAQVYGQMFPFGQFGPGELPPIFKVFQSTTGAFSNANDEPSTQTVWPGPSGTFQNMLGIYWFNTTPNDSNIVMSLRVNGAYSGISTTARNNGTFKVVYDTTHTKNVVAGDLLNWIIETTGPSGDNNHRVQAFCFIVFIPS